MAVRMMYIQLRCATCVGKDSNRISIFNILYLIKIMGLYEGIKDVAKVIQQADNVELYKQLIDLSSQALELQNEISRISAENAELKKMRDVESRIVRHSEPYVTLKDDCKQILFCSHCWDYEQKLIQVKLYDSGKFKCIHCKNDGTYNAEMYEVFLQKERETFRSISLRNRRNYY